MTTDSNLFLRDNVVIVTGAGQGLGLATALGFGQRGAKVAFADNNEATLKDAVIFAYCRYPAPPAYDTGRSSGSHPWARDAAGLLRDSQSP
jgi:NAD(P)-dependent dehydrogenase (short-subunit alcohol dehydrogenase family)